MCGIAGLFDHRQRYSPDERVHIVTAMAAQLRHRGPDASGLWQSKDACCVLGHTRLAIIDLDERSNQPMVDASGRYVISFNGEIYNFQPLRAELEARGAVFRTASDTEVLTEGYARWGDALFARLDGMFAVAVYDTLEGTLVLARDRVGEKPLYVASVDGAMGFCSELKPLLAIPGLSKAVSDASLFEYFALRYVADPHTIFEHIRSVQPGTVTVIDAEGGCWEKSYFAFDIDPASQREATHTEDYVALLENALTESVKTRLTADVPVGAFLSSGVDSSLVCAIAAKKLGSHVRCFSAGFVGGKENETGVAKKIADHLGLPFEQCLVSPDDILKTATDFGGLLDEPNGDRSCVPTYFLSGLIKSQVTVAVSGDGGDELFGGYSRYGPMPPEAHLAGGEVDGVCGYFAQRLPVFPLQGLGEAFPEASEQFRRRVASRYVSAFARSDLSDTERLRLIDMHSYLPGAVLAKVDRMSMRHSLEVRSPFFSPAMFDLSARLPQSMCDDGRAKKVALRRVLSRYVPEALIRPDKQGFGMPASFFQAYSGIFDGLARKADESLAEWEPFRGRSGMFEHLRRAARSNINSYWAWIVLGQWAQNVPAAEGV